MPRRECAAECAVLMQAGYVYVDVRTVQEFEAGHPAGSYNIPAFLPGPSGMALNPAFVGEMKAHFALETSIVLGCRTGARSLSALRILEAEGFTDLVDNEAGWLGTPASVGWSAAGLPSATVAEAGRDYASLKR